MDTGWKRGARVLGTNEGWTAKVKQDINFQEGGDFRGNGGEDGDEHLLTEGPSS